MTFSVLCLFLTVSYAGLQCVVVVFPGYTHLLSNGSNKFGTMENFSEIGKVRAIEICKHNKNTILAIGVAPITQLGTCEMKSVHIQWKSPNMVILLFLTIRNFSQRKEFAPSGSKFFPLRKVPILKRDAINENHCSF